MDGVFDGGLAHWTNCTQELEAAYANRIMKTGLEDDISNFFIADDAIAVVSFIFTSFLSLILLNLIFHPPLFYLLIYFPDKLYSRYYEQAS